MEQPHISARRSDQAEKGFPKTAQSQNPMKRLGFSDITPGSENQMEKIMQNRKETEAM